MQTFKTTNSIIKQSIHALKIANSDMAAAKKVADREKEIIAAWLLKEKKTNIETLPIGANLVVQDENGIDLLTLNVTGVENLNRAALSLAYPGIIEKFTEAIPRRTMKALI